MVLVFSQLGWIQKIPQLGNVIIEDDVEIGSTVV
jgi:UDP-3-O-[3-hydroxymyristoyl] glucosamine N-acyltransferase